jgi:hypothetical protein
VSERIEDPFSCGCKLEDDIVEKHLICGGPLLENPFALPLFTLPPSQYIVTLRMTSIRHVIRYFAYRQECCRLAERKLTGGRGSAFRLISRPRDNHLASGLAVTDVYAPSTRRGTQRRIS